MVTLTKWFINQIHHFHPYSYLNCFFFLLLLENTKDNHVNIIAKSNSDKVNCGSIVKELSVKCHGNGGGSKAFAQGGGSNAENLADFLKEMKNNL